MFNCSSEIRRTSNLANFLRHVEMPDYETLLQRSNDDPEWFWQTLLDYFGVVFDAPAKQFRNAEKGPEHIDWCVDAKANLTRTCLDRQIEAGLGDNEAISWSNEAGDKRSWSYTQLLEESCRVANALASRGVGPGDAVGIFMPMIPEVSAAFMGAARLGAIIVPLFSGFAAPAIATRLNDADAKAVLTTDATVRAGRITPMEPVLIEALASVPSVETVISLRRFGGKAANNTRDLNWSEVVGNASSNFTAYAADAEDVLMIAYTSGTTGKPKGVVQTHLGLLAKAAADFVLCLDLRPGDRHMWMTDMGWVMGPLIVVSAPLAGATLVLAEGAPSIPSDPFRILRLVDEHKVTNLGISPTLVRQLMAQNPDELAQLDLSTLRILPSTGEPWSEEAWIWHFEKIGSKHAVPLNIAGGTEMVGGILTSTVLHEIKPCGFTTQCLGVGAKILRKDGNQADPGEVGELVVTNPPMGLTRGLWHDEKRYIETYWSTYPGIWHHGDWARQDPDGTWYILGRSDDTINVAGKRVGPPEIESAVMQGGEIVDAAAIAAPDDLKGIAVICFCVPANGITPDDKLDVRLGQKVAEQVGKPFKPREIIYVSELPKTRSMKTMRRVVLATYNGTDPGDLSSLHNRQAIDALKTAMEKMT